MFSWNQQMWVRIKNENIIMLENNGKWKERGLAGSLVDFLMIPITGSRLSLTHCGSVSLLFSLSFSLIFVIFSGHCTWPFLLDCLTCICAKFFLIFLTLFEIWVKCHFFCQKAITLTPSKVPSRAPLRSSRILPRCLSRATPVISGQLLSFHSMNIVR